MEGSAIDARAYVGNMAGHLHIYNLKDLLNPDPAPLEDLQQQSELISAYRISDSGHGRVQLTSREWADRWAKKEQAERPKPPG